MNAKDILIGKEIYHFEKGEMIILKPVNVDKKRKTVMMDNGKRYSYNSIGFLFEERKDGIDDSSG